MTMFSLNDFFLSSEINNLDIAIHVYLMTCRMLTTVQKPWHW